MPKPRNKADSLAVIEPHASGIDVGTMEIYAAIPADRDATPVRCFPTLTVDLDIAVGCALRPANSRHSMRRSSATVSKQRAGSSAAPADTPGSMTADHWAGNTTGSRSVPCNAMR